VPVQGGRPGVQPGAELAHAQFVDALGIQDVDRLSRTIAARVSAGWSGSRSCLAHTDGIGIGLVLAAISLPSARQPVSVP
jgi:hypothetical protein